MGTKLYLGTGFYDISTKSQINFSELIEKINTQVIGPRGPVGEQGPAGPQGQKGDSSFIGGTSSTPYNEKSYIRYPFAGDNFELHIEGGNTLPGKYVTLGIRNKSDTPKIFSYAFKIDGSSTRSEKVKTLLPGEIMYTPLSVQCDPDWLNTGFIADISSGTISTFSLYISGRQNESMTDSIMGVKIVSLS